MSVSETIVALATPPGRSGIGVIRLSGAASLPLTRSLLRNEQFAPEVNRVSLQTIIDPDGGAVLDRALITYFKAPHSFTGEDVIEISCHGSPVLLLHVVDALLRLGARAAKAGEFTLRALAHGRLSLSQAEAVRDLIDAQTDAAVRQAARQLGGELAARLKPIKDTLIEIIVPLESALEFVEDDLPDVAFEHVRSQLKVLLQQLEELAASFRSGRLLKEGLKVTIVGRPNVGKSSVFNRLLRADRAIVTDVAGTTRDSLSEPVNIQGVPVLLFDTAGVRASDDLIETIGIERTRRAMVDADLLIIVLDGAQALTGEDKELLSSIRENKYFIALNKCDLPAFSTTVVRAEVEGVNVVSVSAKTGAGFEELRAAILAPFATGKAQAEGFLITNARHYDLLRRAAEILRAADSLVADRVSEDLLLAKLYDALKYLGEITGETTPDDVLTQIFATFCIGK